MLSILDPIINWVTENYAVLIGAVIATLAIGYVVLRLTIVGFARWRLNGYKHHGGSRRFLKPKSWFKLQPRSLFKAKNEILSSPAVREFYAPVELYKEEREEKKVYIRAAWLSPFYRAVRASIAQNKAAIKGWHFKARKQVADAAQSVMVRPLPKSYPVAGDRSLHFEVSLDLARRERSKVAALGESILSAVEGESIETYERGRTNRSESFIVHMVEPESILTAQKIDGASFFRENPACKWSSFPMAINEMGDVWSLPVTHTLVYGMTGSGKSSPLQSTIIQAIPFVERGEALLYGSDLKETELLAWDYSTLFEDIAFTADDSIEMISMFYKKLVERNKMKRAWLSFEEGNTDLQRRLPATKRTPMMIFVVDELLTLLLELFQRGAEGKAAIANLAKIMVLGRSVGFYVVAATQNVKQEFLGPLRDSFMVTITLRNQATETMNNMMLGEGAVERGFDPRKIAESTEANDYKTSGIGYVKGKTGDPMLVRFAFSDDEYVASYARKYPDERKMATLESGELEEMLHDSADGEDINERLDALTSTDREGFLKVLNAFKSESGSGEL